VDWRKTNSEWQGICRAWSGRREATSKYIQWKLGLLDEKPSPVLDVEAAKA